MRSETLSGGGLFPLDKTNICMYFIKGQCRHQGEWNHLSTVVVKHFGKTCFHPQSVALRLMTRCRTDGRWGRTTSGLHYPTMKWLRRTTVTLRRHTGILANVILSDFVSYCSGFWLDESHSIGSPKTLPDTGHDRRHSTVSLKGSMFSVFTAPSTGHPITYHPTGDVIPECISSQTKDSKTNGFNW